MRAVLIVSLATARWRRGPRARREPRCWKGRPRHANTGRRPAGIICVFTVCGGCRKHQQDARSVLNLVRGLYQHVCGRGCGSMELHSAYRFAVNLCKLLFNFISAKSLHQNHCTQPAQRHCGTGTGTGTTPRSTAPRRTGVSRPCRV